MLMRYHDHEGSTGDGSFITRGLPINTNGIKNNAITSAKIADGTIADADISDIAAISDSKLATIATAGKVSDSALSSNITKFGSSIDTADITDGAVTATKLSTAARTRSASLYVGDLAAGTSVDLPIMIAQGNITLTKVSFANLGAINQNDTDYLALSIGRARSGSGGNLVFAYTKATGGVALGGVNWNNTYTGTFSASVIAGDVVYFQCFNFGAGRSLSQFITTIEYTVSE